MATNYTQPGDVINYTCGSSEEVSSGDVVFVNGIPGVALVDIGNDETGAVQITGVFEISKKADATHGAVFAVGEPVYYDAAEEEAAKTAGLLFLGYAFEAATAADTTVNVLLAGDSKDAPIPVKAGEALTAGDLVYPSGYDADKDIIEVSKADADAADPAKVAWYIVPADIGNGALGIARRSLLVTGINTDAVTAVGDPIYLHTTAGAWTDSAPTAAGAAVQQVGVLTAKSETAGAILFLVGDSKAVSVNTTA